MSLDSNLSEQSDKCFYWQQVPKFWVLYKLAVCYTRELFLFVLSGVRITSRSYKYFLLCNKQPLILIHISLLPKYGFLA